MERTANRQRRRTEGEEEEGGAREAGLSHTPPAPLTPQQEPMLGSSSDPNPLPYQPISAAGRHLQTRRTLRSLEPPRAGSSFKAS